MLRETVSKELFKHLQEATAALLIQEKPAEPPLLPVKLTEETPRGRSPSVS